MKAHVDLSRELTNAMAGFVPEGETGAVGPWKPQPNSTAFAFQGSLSKVSSGYPLTLCGTVVDLTT